MLAGIWAEPGVTDYTRCKGVASMFGRRVSLALLTATVLTLGSLVSTPAFGQVTLYDNGPDGDIGYFHVNFGSAVTNRR